MDVTTESIRAAHALDTHPSNEFWSWDASDLDRSEQPDDSELPGALLALRVTYQDSDGNPLEAADFVTLLPASDSTVRDAASISGHADVWGVAIYPADSDGTRSPYPVAVLMDGQPIPLDGNGR